MQIALYFQVYHTDRRRIKMLVRDYVRTAGRRLETLTVCRVRLGSRYMVRLASQTLSS